MGTNLTDFEVAYGFTLQQWVSSGGSAGEYMQNYNKWLEDPIAFHQTQPIPYFAIYNESADAESSSEALPDVNQEIDRIRRQAENKDENKPGYFKIGTVELTVPPIQISVNDIKHNHVYKTLRTKSDIVMQSGHATKIIELDIYFHDIDEINNKLRPLLAQLKCSPFVPIYSNYLRTVLNPEGPGEEIGKISYDGKEQDLVSESRKIDSDIDKLKVELRKVIGKNDSIMSAKKEIIINLNEYWDGTLDYLNSSKLDQNKSLTDNIDNVLIDVGIAENKEDKKSIRYKASEVDIKINELRRLKVEKFNKSKEPQDNGNLVGVLSQINIGTVAGFPESLACHATFFLFNYMPFSTKFEFLDKENKPTLDIDKCLYFVQWYASRFLSPIGNIPDKYYEPLNGQMDGKVLFSYLNEGDDNGIMVETEENSVCIALTIAQRNSIVFLPVLEWGIPTCQYMGAHNAVMILTIDTIDNTFIDRLRRVFDAAEEESRSSDKIRRENYISIDNELIRLMGIKRCVLQGLTTATVEGAPGMTRIQLKLIEFDVKQLKGETIKKAINVNDSMMREYFRADLQSYIDDPKNVSDKNGFRKLIENNETYKSAVGYVEVFRPEIGLRMFGDEPGHVPFTSDKRMIGNMTKVINDYGLEVTTQKSPIKIKTDKTAEEKPYSDSIKLEVSKFLKQKILEPEGGDTIQIDDYTLDCVLWNSNTMDKYRDTINIAVESYLGGNSVALPDNVMEMFAKKGLAQGESRPIWVYPDLDLPTYIDTKRVGEGAIKPKYTRLGTLNPAGDQYDTPRIDSDMVEPDFYFNYQAISDSRGVTGEWDLNYWGKIEEAINMFFEDFIRIRDKDVPNFLKGAYDRLFNTKMSDIGADDLFNKEGSEEVDKVVEEGQEEARSLRDVLESTKLEPTSPEENNRYYEAGENVPIDNFPDDYWWYKNAAKRKVYSDPFRDSDTDTGIDAYGGIAPDSSIYKKEKK